MTAESRFDRQLPAILDDLYLRPSPDYRADVLAAATAKRQRPAWTFPGRWIPMLEIARQPVVQNVPWRPIVVLLILLGLLAAGLVLAATQPRLPPLNGPAGNGLVAWSHDGDIVTFDPRTGATAVIVSGPEIDLDPVWSQDGTRLLFRRESPAQPEAEFLMLARADGSGVRQLTPEPMTGLTSKKVASFLAPALHYAWSPDGSKVVIVSTVKGMPALFVADTDTRALTPLVISSTPLGAAFDPTGTQILFTGAQGFDGSYAGLYVTGADGSNLRTLVAPQLDAPVWSRAYWSPDGTRIAYARRQPGFAAEVGDRGDKAIRHDMRVHVVSADGSGEAIVGHQDGAWWEAPTGWSPDGQRLLIERSLQADEVGAPFEAVIIDIDGRLPDLVPQFTSPNDWAAAWSPDGTTILATPGDSDGNGLQQQLWDTRTGEAKSAPWTATSFPAWQRIAP